ncbi:iron complex outermembrane receptor protein [Paucibacter oligotrophus]|uniref:Iron complex outermembrane receptor protein n=1 Tax=Roseateles oligotrophus TaxID=1769250 RepID=A0A840LIM9_9BURK|nr:TonB-dependent siderophore receptor [Roseateles oligotrophus]MBB4845127.1 iron complex outermembrane receptor protein [Roseateles oligotrophus]
MHRQHARPAALHPLALAVLLALGGTLAHTPARAQSAASAQTTAYDLPAGPLDATLTGIARRAGRIIVIDPALVSGRTAGPVRGNLTLEQAFAQALAGSGLEIAPGGDGGYTLKKAPPAPTKPEAAAPRKESVLPVVTVRAGAELETATGPVQGYAAKRSATATKTDTPITEVPQSVSVIGREEIDAKGMREVLDTLNYTPGVFTRTYGRDDRGYEFLTLRGFDSSTHDYLDGLAQLGFVDIGQMTEVYGMERIEVLRGPSSATFGQGDVGGIVNRVSKRPSLNEPIREAQVQLGNFKHRQLAIDYGDRIGDDLAFRLVGLTRSNDDQAKYPGGERAETKRQYFAPSLLWQPSAATSLTLLASTLQHEAGDDVGYVADANRQPTNVREGDPRYSRIVHKAWTLGYEFRHDFSDNLGFRQKFRYADRETDKHHIRSSLQADGRTFTRTAVHGFGDLKQTSLDSFLEGRLQTGDVAHRLIAGVDWTRVRAKEQYLTGSAPDLDLLNPVYLPIPAPNTPGGVYGPNKLRSVGLYVQDQAKFADRWLLTLSGRHDTAKGEDSSSSRGGTQSSTHKAWTGRAALTWLAPGGWAPYVSYGTSFQPAFGAFDALDAKPTEGKQWEAGVKYQPKSGDLLLTAAVFDLEKTNITVTNPLSGISEQVGAVRSRGLELEAKGKLMPDLFATASFTYNDIKGRKGDTWYVEQGKTPIQAPKQMASLWLDYTFRDSGLHGLNIGAGARYVGKRWDDAANTKSQPGFTLFDASLRYDLDSHWRLALNATNLFNKRYYTSNAFDGWYRGEERTVTATATYRW